MRIFKTINALAIIGLMLVACRKENASQDDIRVDSVVMEANDSVVADSIEEEKVPLLTTSKEILEYMEKSGHKDAYDQGILPQMAHDVPKYAGRILASQEDGFLIVDKNTMKCYRYDKYGVLQESVGIACSKYYGTKHKKRDNRTPEGYFTIQGIYDSEDWLYTDDDGNTSDVKGQFGPKFMRLKIPVTSQIGIHGTSSPWSIGGRRSHGCIRMTNENILRFVEICKPGWPVIVSPGPKDLFVNDEEDVDVPTVAVIRGKPRCTKRINPYPQNVPSSEPEELKAPAEESSESSEINENDDTPIKESGSVNGEENAVLKEEETTD